MKRDIMVCGGYSPEQGSDLLVISLEENGAKVIAGYRQGENPTFCLRKDGFLYTVEEVSGHTAIRAWEIGEGGALKATDRRIETSGGEPCHLYAGERALFVSCYETGDFFAVDYDLKEVLWHRSPTEGKEAHGHWATLWQNELFLADLGSDRVWRYKMEEGLPTEELAPLVLVPGAGPRQTLAPAEDGKYLLSIQELDGTLCLWKKEDGVLSCVDTIKTTYTDKVNYPGTICMADESTVLVCNRGPNTVSAVRIQNGTLSLIGEWETADWPRHLVRAANTGIFVNSCNRAGKLVLFAWDGKELQNRGEIDLHGACCAAQV